MLAFHLPHPEKQATVYRENTVQNRLQAGTLELYTGHKTKERRPCPYARTCAQTTGEPDSPCCHLDYSHAGNLLQHDDLALRILRDSRILRDAKEREMIQLPLPHSKNKKSHVLDFDLSIRKRPCYTVEENTTISHTGGNYNDSG